MVKYRARLDVLIRLRYVAHSYGCNKPVFYRSYTYQSYEFAESSDRVFIESLCK